MVTTRKRSLLANTSSPSPVEDAHPKKLKVSTRRNSRKKGVINTSSSSTSRIGKVAPPKKQQVSTISTTSPNPSEIPKELYDLIKRAFRCMESLKLNSNNRFGKSKLEEYEMGIRSLSICLRYNDELPFSWEYNPETSFMVHVPKPPTPPKTKPKPKPKKKKIRITWSSPNYHGAYPVNNEEQEAWNKFRMNDTTEAQKCMIHPSEKYLIPVQNEDAVVNLLGKFAVDTFNKSCHMYVNKDEENQVSEAAVVDCKYYKLTTEYIFYMIIEAIEKGKPGVYEAGVKCVPDNGARTLCRFVLMDRKPKWKRPWAKPRLESEFEYETVEDGSSDPQDFYLLTGLAHRTHTEGGGFNYHNPSCAAHRVICKSIHDKRSRYFLPNVSQPLSTKTMPMD